jgi:hypothetical protein
MPALLLALALAAVPPQAPQPAPPPLLVVLTDTGRERDGLPVYTTLFDQFRALPRRHTFDLNAASLVDLLTVEGVTSARRSP